MIHCSSVNVKTTKYCGHYTNHYNDFTLSRYADLTRTRMCIEKDFNSQK